MLTHDNLIVILYSLPIYQLLFYSIQLVSFRKSNPSRKYLGLLLITMTLFLILNVLYQLGNLNLMLRVYPFFIPLLLALPPVFFLYIFSLAREKDQLSRLSKLVLFIPSVIVLFANLFTFGFTSVRQREIFLLTDHSPFNTSPMAADAALIVLWVSIFLLLFMQIVFAIARIQELLRTEKKAVEQQPAHLAYFQFKWIYITSVSVLIFLLIGAIQIIFFGKPDLTVALAFNIIVLISGGLAGFYGMKQDNLLNEVSGVGSISDKLDQQSEKMNSSSNAKKINNTVKSVAEEESQQIIRKIEMLMEENKPFLNKHFTIDDLCRLIEFRRSKVTMVINDVMGKNFHGLVNDYRVREAIRIFETDNSNPTMDAVADMVGFHSRSSFYACFKKYTGQTPKEFLSTNVKNDQVG